MAHMHHSFHAKPYPNPIKTHIPAPLRHATTLEMHYIREGTFVFLEGLMDQHVALEFVFPVESCITH